MNGYLLELPLASVNPFFNYSIANTGGRQASGLYIVNTAYNINRSTAAQALDSAFAWLGTSGGGIPALLLRRTPTVSISIIPSGGIGYFYSAGPIYMTPEGTTRMIIRATGIQVVTDLFPSTPDTRTNGTVTKPWKETNVTDYNNTGGKGQTAQLNVGTADNLKSTTDLDSLFRVQIGTNGMVQQLFDSSYVWRGTISMPDNSDWTAPTGICGKFFIMAGDMVEYATGTFKNDGSVTLASAAPGITSANVTTTNGTDTKLNIYDAGSGIAIDNQLGSTTKVMVVLEYFYGS